MEPEKPNFGNSGLLARETNTIKGVQLKYNEPPEARKPLKNWRLYVFNGTVDFGISIPKMCRGDGIDTMQTSSTSTDNQRTSWDGTQWYVLVSPAMLNVSPLICPRNR